MRTPVFRYLLKQGDNYVRLVEQNLITVEQLLARHERRCPECRFQVCLIESRRQRTHRRLGVRVSPQQWTCGLIETARGCVFVKADAGAKPYEISFFSQVKKKPITFGYSQWSSDENAKSSLFCHPKCKKLTDWNTFHDEFVALRSSQSKLKWSSFSIKCKSAQIWSDINCTVETSKCLPANFIKLDHTLHLFYTS